MEIIYLNSLTPEEKEILFQAPAVVAYLIGGADNDFDKKQVAQSKHIVKLRSSFGDTLLFDFFTTVNENFDVKLDALVQKYQHLQAEERTTVLVNELTALNNIFAKIDTIYVKALVNSLRSYAKEVAKASGGFLGMLDINYEEEHLIGLEMLTIQED